MDVTGEIWYFRPGGPVSPKREHHRLILGAYASYRSGDELLSWARAISVRRGGLASAREHKSSMFLFSSSRLGKRSSPERENPLAWARDWARSVLVLLFLCSWMLVICFDWLYF